MATPFPAGVRFCPSDKELIVSYLQRRAQGLPIFPGLVIDYDVYGCEPWELPSHYFIYGEEGHMFFFTPRQSLSTRRLKKMSRFHVRRTAGEGSWESCGSGKPICNGEAVIGSKSALVFKCKDQVTGAVIKTDWIMHEYLLVSPANQFQSLALCKIYYKGKGDVNDWESMTNTKKRKLSTEPPRTCAATFSAYSDLAGPVFSPPEISSYMTQWGESGDQVPIPKQLVTREVMQGESASPSYYCTTINLSSEGEEIPTFSVYSDVAGPVFSPPEIGSCMTQGEASGYQFLVPEQLVTREEVQGQSAAAIVVPDQEVLTELASPSHQCTSVNLPSQEEEILTPMVCFEGLDDILNLQDYDDLWVSSYWH